jgi:hypothetical protein
MKRRHGMRRAHASGDLRTGDNGGKLLGHPRGPDPALQYQ